ncbi:MAG: hypothetical protein HOU01_15330 [Streptomycetaceae bacterium]|nr:hypothetical protein [Streptomycetaceae bacterium]
MTAGTLSWLRNLRPDTLDAAARQWLRLTADVENAAGRAAAEVAGVLTTTVWQGADADAAARQFDDQEAELRIATQEAAAVAALIGRAAQELAAAQRNGEALLAEASAAGFQVDDNGTIRPIAAAEDPADATRIAAALITVLDSAAMADRRFAAVLRDLAPEAVRPGLDRWADAVDDGTAVALLARIDARAIPSAASPDAVRAWWTGLDDGARQRFLVGCPAVLGKLDGLPATVRDRANRLLLHASEADLRRELRAAENALARAGARNGGGPALVSRIGDLRRRLAGVETLRGHLESAAHRYGPTYLLAFAPDGDYAAGGRGRGRAVIAVGNPDHARHTAVFVPGMGVGLDAAGDELGRVADLRAAAQAKTGSPDVAAVAWIGYDTPDRLTQALDPRYAERAAPHLDRFTGGLRAAHEPGAGHLTVIGHSYGSLVVGEAAQTGSGLHADDIVVVGSPGVHATRATQLGTGPGHVWVGRAQGDPVPGLGAMTYASPVTGTTPTDPAFGANRFTTDGAAGHSDYWSTARPDSLANQAAIVAGRYGDVRLVSGAPPPDGKP